MKALGYVIRKIYTDGLHKGKSYIYIRGVYVRDEKDLATIFPEDMYKTPGTAKGAITRYLKALSFEPTFKFEIIKVMFDKNLGRNYKVVYTC